MYKTTTTVFLHLDFILAKLSITLLQFTSVASYSLMKSRANLSSPAESVLLFIGHFFGDKVTKPIPTLRGAVE